jgi:hypothetical protein
MSAEGDDEDLRRLIDEVFEGVDPAVMEKLRGPAEGRQGGNRAEEFVTRILTEVLHGATPARMPDVEHLARVLIRVVREQDRRQAP